MYIFFLDIDGTIYDSNQVADEVIDAMSRARDMGHKIFINTARAYIGMPQRVYELPIDGFVNSYGLEVFVDGKFIHRSFIPRERVLEIAKYAFDNNVKLYFEGEIRININRKRDGGLNPKDMKEFVAMLGESQVCKFVLMEGPSDADRKMFSADFDFYGIEAIAKGYKKSYGIEIVENHYGISHENTVAIGDTDSDIDMVKYAGIGISMGNGTPDLKKCADYVTRSVWQYGVAFAINCILDGKLSELEQN